MAERYQNLHVLHDMQYLPGAPVLLMAGSLLRDSYSMDLLCQLRLHSLSRETIKAVTVVICMLDPAGDVLVPSVRHQYLDLSLLQDEEFGQNTAIVLPRRDARAFTANVQEVIFEDNRRWKPEAKSEWVTMPKPKSLEEAFGDVQMAEQFRISFGQDCRLLPAEEGCLWFCTCGAVNNLEEQVCHRCRRVRSALMNVNRESLRLEADVRLRQEQESQAEKLEIFQKRRQKWLKAAVVIVPLLILSAGLLKVMPGYLQQKRDYRSAEALLAAGYYEEASKAFTALGNYRDSLEQAEKNIPYQRALDLMVRADNNDAAALRLIGKSRADLTDRVTAGMLLYQAALEEFEALDGYRESGECIARCREGIAEQEHAILQGEYENAMQLLEAGNFSQARQQFLALRDYEDSAEMAKEAIYRKARGLYDYICHYDVRKVYADLSISPDRGSSFVIPKDAALSMGSQCVSDLYASCGNDPADVNLTGVPGESMQPLAVCVTQLFEQLEGYRDSADCLAGIQDATDYTKDFYLLCETGDLQSALEWLDTYEGEFHDRDLWQARLELYLPFCTSWSLYSGDATVIPLTVWRSGKCTGCTTRVLLTRESNTLRLSANDGEEYYFDLYADQDDTFFSNYDDPAYNYVLVINNVGRMSYLKYDTAGNLVTSCEYSRG